MLYSILLTALVSALPPGAEASPETSQKSIQAGLKFIDAGGAEIEKDATCINCHHSSLRSLSNVEEPGSKAR